MKSLEVQPVVCCKLTYIEDLCYNQYIDPLCIWVYKKQMGIVRYTMKIDKGLIGGSAVLLLLSLLEGGDRYGYEIIKELESLSDSTFSFKEGSLYPVLHKLESKGYIESYIKSYENGRDRKYYRITQNGIKQLAYEKEQWQVFTRSVNKVIGGEKYAL